MGVRRSAFSVLVGKLEVKRPLGRPRHKWDGNINIDHQEIIWEGVDFISLAEEREKQWDVVNMVMSPHVSKMHVISSLADKLLASERLLHLVWLSWLVALLFCLLFCWLVRFIIS
jgi:hypothetical protein